MKTLFTFFALSTTSLFAQQDSNKLLTFNGYGELYYSYDFSNPQQHEKGNFIYNHKRHNEINTNLIVVKANYNDTTTRGNLGLMLGNYAHYNLSAEPTWAQFIYEANIGLKLSKTHNLWLDVGIMPSHIGFESAINDDCWTLTRSILAENSPYFETGLKMSYTNKTEKLNLALLVLNGWQRIQKPADMQNPSFGLQINYKAFGNLTLNYSNFIGTDKPDSLHAIRVFNNVYVQYEPKMKLAFIAGFDLGTDKFNATNYGLWFSPVVIVRYSFNPKLKLAFRGEHYNDKRQIIIHTNTINGFQVKGLSANLDYKFNPKVKWRLEAKWYNAKDPIFENNNNNYSLTTNMTIKL